MQQTFKPATSDAAIVNHMKMQRSNGAISTTTITAQGAGSGAGSGATTAEELPLRTHSPATSTEIYIVGGGGGGGSNPATLERKQQHRLSWVNMRRIGESSVLPTETVTPSPHTSRSYILTSSGIGGGGGGGGGGTASGRTTSASGRVSASCTTTITGSNNTLNDIISDYHSQEVASSDYHYTASTSSPAKNLSSNGSFNIANGSTVKLLPAVDDESNQQVSF